MASIKKFLSFVGREMARSITFGTFLILFVAWAVYALSYPSTPPTGETAGGKFMQYFNSIKVTCPDGQYLNGYDANYNKICATVPAGPQGPTGAQGPQWPAGADGATPNLKLLYMYYVSGTTKEEWDDLVITAASHFANLNYGWKDACLSVTTDGSLTADQMSNCIQWICTDRGWYVGVDGVLLENYFAAWTNCWPYSDPNICAPFHFVAKCGWVKL